MEEALFEVDSFHAGIVVLFQLRLASQIQTDLHLDAFTSKYLKLNPTVTHCLQWFNKSISQEELMQTQLCANRFSKYQCSI